MTAAETQERVREFLAAYADTPVTTAAVMELMAIAARPAYLSGAIDGMAEIAEIFAKALVEISRDESAIQIPDSILDLLIDATDAARLLIIKQRAWNDQNV